MKFKGFDGTELEIRKGKDAGEDHDHLMIVKDGVIQWYFHIFDNHIDVFSGGCSAPISERQNILVESWGRDMRMLTKEV